MKQTLERELKLQAPGGFVMPQFAGRPIGPRRFTSTYFDTPDLLLSSQSITLRRRVENRKGLWQLKLPRGAARLELEEPGGPTRPPEAIMRLLVAALRGAEVLPIARIRTLRTGTVVQEEGKDIAEVVYDLAQVLQGGRIASRFNEIEIELVGGDEQDLKNLESTLRSAGAWLSDQRSKVSQALNLVQERPVRDRKPPSELARLQSAIAEQFQAMVDHDPGTRLGTDPEDLHLLRVGVRRLRSLLWAASGLLEPEWTEALRGELEWIGDQMNPVRDLDVMIPYLRSDLSELEPDEAEELEPFMHHLEAERIEARRVMLAAMDGERYLALLHTLEDATRSIRVRPQEAGFREGAVKAFRKMRKAARAMQDPLRDDEMHLVRRLAKKSRYSAEVVRVGGGKAVAAFLTEIKPLQDVLGDHQDAVVAEQRIRDHLALVQNPKAAFALGRMAERQAFKEARCRKEFPAAWRAVNRAGRKAWL